MSHQYNDEDRARLLNEVGTGRSARTEFARDRARVTHSSALRRLGAKTQVLQPGSGDFARTRLTHSLEVAQVGREMAVEFGVDPDVVDSACLAHDLGHPPFGHNGEKALNDWAQDFGGFEGNAQTFRILTRLESKTFKENRSIGLNLTRATLDATTKYPWEFDGSITKFGFYEEDREIFNWVRKNITGNNKSFEAQVMDIADDIAYSVHDIEDAIYGKLINPKQLSQVIDKSEIVSLAKNEYAKDIETDLLQDSFEGLLSQTWWVKGFTAEQDEMAKLKNMTSHLIGKFTEEIEKATKNEFTEKYLTRYAANLIVPMETRAQIAVLKAIVNLFVMQSTSAVKKYAHEHEIINEIFEGLSKNPKRLQPQFLTSFTKASSENESKRVIIDQIASLTDSSAFRLHKEFVG